MQRTELQSGSGGRLGIGAAAGRADTEPLLVAASNAVERGWVDEVEWFDTISELLGALDTGSINMALRGNLPSLDLVEAWPQSSRPLHRAALVADPSGRLHLIAPVGIADRGRDLIQTASILWKEISGERPRIAVLGPGRAEDRHRGGNIGERIEKAQQLAEHSGADFLGILVESAGNHDLWIFDSGVLGNLVFRCLHFLGGWTSLGAPVLGPGRVFVDTSAARTSWLEPIRLAAALSARRRRC